MNKKKKRNQELNKIMTQPQLPTMKELKKEELVILKLNEENEEKKRILKQNEKIKEEYLINVANGNKEIRIYSISEEEIKLKETINIMTNTIENLYNKIRKETGKVNIASLIINEYIYTNENYSSIECNTIVDTSNNRELSIIPKIPKISDILSYRYKKLSTLLNKDYNKDYIEVSLIFGSYMFYIKKIIKKYSYEIYTYNNLSPNELKLLKLNPDEPKEENKINFLYNLNKINCNYLSSLDYDNIKLYIVTKINYYICNDNDRLLHQEFLLNEIEKYFTID